MFTLGGWEAINHFEELHLDRWSIFAGDVEIARLFTLGDSEATANLIAAAPDMYEELKGVRRTLKVLLEDGWITGILALAIRDRIKSIDKALAKAEGK